MAEFGPIDLQQRRGQDKIGHADGGGHRPGKGAHIDHPLPPVQPLHGRNGPGGIPKLRIVIVLNKIPPRPPIGPFQQFPPPGHGGGDPQRKLMGGGHIGHIGPRYGQGLHRHSLPVHRHRHMGPVQVIQQPVERGIPRVLQPEHRPGQQLEQYPHQPFHPGPQHHLFRGAVHPPVLVEKPGQGLPQGPVPLSVPPLEQVGIFIDRLLVQPCPHGVGKH